MKRTIISAVLSLALVIMTGCTSRDALRYEEETEATSKSETEGGIASDITEQVGDDGYTDEPYWITQEADSKFEDDSLAAYGIKSKRNENGETIINTDGWAGSDDYDLFREIFFGKWKKSASVEESELIIDDSPKCFLANNYPYWFDMFYHIGETTVYAFETSGNAEQTLYWIDTGEPNIMYCTALADNKWLYAFDGTSGIDQYYKSGTVIRSDGTAVNSAVNGYLSVFRLREIALEYEIDYALLTEMELKPEGSSYMLYHDDTSQFYNVYLVEETLEKLTLKTSVGNVYIPSAGQVDVTYTLEKINDVWVRAINPAS